MRSKSLRALLLISVVLAGVATVRVAGDTEPRSAGDNDPRTAAGTDAPTSGDGGRGSATATIKPVITGLIDRDGIAAPDVQSVVNSFVVNVGWAELQPEQGGAIMVDNPIDQAVSTARQAAARPQGEPIQVKVRLFSGVQAPDWAKQLGGPSVPVTDTVDGRSGSVGRFWEPEFGRAYAKLQEQLAARYDDVAEIAEVTASRCTTIYAEPFVRQVTDPGTVKALLDAGFSADADRRCLEEQVEAHRVWSLTRTSVAFNPYQRIEPDGSVLPDVDFTKSMMRQCRKVLGPRCVLENNSIRWPPLRGKAYDAMYETMSQLGPPLAFQTAVPRRIGDWRATLQWAVDRGANAVELNSEYRSYPAADLARFAAGLKGNQRGS
ncbi:MAG: hypothetical protein ABIS21_06950 [Acidimicrobiales bacterium]